MRTINCEIKGEFITLVQLLKYESIISSGGEIAILMDKELIKYNGIIELQKRKKCYAGDKIEIENTVTILIIPQK